MSRTPDMSSSDGLSYDSDAENTERSMSLGLDGVLDREATRDQESHQPPSSKGTSTPRATSAVRIHGSPSHDTDTSGSPKTSASPTTPVSSGAGAVGARFISVQPAPALHSREGISTNALNGIQRRDGSNGGNGDEEEEEEEEEGEEDEDHDEKDTLISRRNRSKASVKLPRRPLVDSEWEQMLGMNRPSTIYTGRMTYERAHELGGNNAALGNTSQMSDYPPSHVIAPGDQILLAFPRRINDAGQCVRTSGAPTSDGLLAQAGGDNDDGDIIAAQQGGQPLTLFLPGYSQISDHHLKMARAMFIILVILIPVHVFVSVLIYLDSSKHDKTGPKWEMSRVESIFDDCTIPFSILSCVILVMGLFSADPIILGLYLIVGYLDAFINLFRLRTGAQGGLFFLQIAMCQFVHRFKTAVDSRWRTI